MATLAPRRLPGGCFLFGHVHRWEAWSARTNRPAMNLSTAEISIQLLMDITTASHEIKSRVTAKASRQWWTRPRAWPCQISLSRTSGWAWFLLWHRPEGHVETGPRPVLSRRVNSVATSDGLTWAMGKFCVARGPKPAVA